MYKSRTHEILYTNEKLNNASDKKGFIHVLNKTLFVRENDTSAYKENGCILSSLIFCCIHLPG